MPKKHILIFIIGFVLLAIATVFGASKLAAVLDKEDSSGASSQTHEHSAETSEGTPVDLTAQAQVNIDIQDYGYNQPNIKVKKGTTVTWTNRDTVGHNAMQEHSGEEHEHSAPAPSEVKPDVFAGPLLAEGESYSFTFNTAGELSYHCAPHPAMKGWVTVVE